MAGNQTNGFDMVMEISEGTLQNLISAIFDNEGFLGNIIPTNIGLLEGFGLTLDFDRATGIPASAANPIQLSFDLNFVGGNSGQLDLVVGMDVDRNDPGLDKVILDFPNQLFRCDLSVTGIPSIVTNAAATLIQNVLDNNTIPLIPIPVDRTSSSSLTIVRADVKVIDDSSSTDNDALGIILSFGGGVAGNLNNFTAAFARDGAGAAVAINFSWICRNISPKIEEGIGLPSGSFAGCSFSGEHEIRDGVKLTRMAIRPAIDFIELTGTVTKSGTCYDASGTFTARIMVAIVAGELRVSFETDDPNIDVDIPWYCYLAAGVLGALLGGIIFGIVGAIVGGVLLPLLLYIAESVVESTIENITQEISDAINGIEDISVQLVGVDSILDTAFIDDMTVGYNLYPQEYWPIKSEGVLTLRSGNYADLDNGIVRSENFGGADLKLSGTDRSRKLTILCGTLCSELHAGKSFAHIRRFDLLMLNYALNGVLPFDLFAFGFPLPFGQSQYFETHRIFAYKSSDGSFGFFTVSKVSNDTFTLKYKTYKSSIYSIDLLGRFSCGRATGTKAKISQGDLIYTNAIELNQISKRNLELNPVLRQETQKMQKLRQIVTAPVLDRMKLDLLADPELKIEPKYERVIGKWSRHYLAELPVKTGHFHAAVTGNLKVNQFTWIVQHNALPQNASGSILINNQKFDYKTAGGKLSLSSKSKVDLDVIIKVVVAFESGLSDQVIKCVSYRNDCRFIKREIPTFGRFLEKYDSDFGLVSV